MRKAASLAAWAVACARWIIFACARLVQLRMVHLLHLVVRLPGQRRCKMNRGLVRPDRGLVRLESHLAAAHTVRAGSLGAGVGEELALYRRVSVLKRAATDLCKQ